MQQLTSIRMRTVTEADIGFIFNSWLKSFRFSGFSKNIANSVYFSGHHKLLERIISTSEIKIACNDADPTQIYGYICGQRVQGILVVHYIYVKQTYRNLGLGKQLLNQFEFDLSKASCYTHQTKLSERLAAKYNMIYHPYLAMELFNDTETEQSRLTLDSSRGSDGATGEIQE